MDSRQIWTIVGISLVVAVISSFATTSITGAVSWPWQQPQPIAISNIRANSCDADSVCEVAKTVSTKAGTGSNLILTSDSKKVFLDAALEPAAEKLTIDGSITLRDLTLEQRERVIIGRDGRISTAPGVSILLSPASGIVDIDSSLIVGGKFFIASLANTANQTMNAYACIDSTGKLFRSEVPCA